MTYQFLFLSLLTNLNAETASGTAPNKVAAPAMQHKALAEVITLNAKGECLRHATGVWVTAGGILAVPLLALREAARVAVKLPDGRRVETLGATAFDYKRNYVLLRFAVSSPGVAATAASVKPGETLTGVAWDGKTQHGKVSRMEARHGLMQMVTDLAVPSGTLLFNSRGEWTGIAGGTERGTRYAMAVDGVTAALSRREVKFRLRDVVPRERPGVAPSNPPKPVVTPQVAVRTAK